MIRLLGLYLMLALQRPERELAFMVGHDRTIRRAHFIAVHREADTLDGNAGAVKHHVARDAVALGDGENHIGRSVTTCIGREGGGKTAGAVVTQVGAGDAGYRHGVCACAPSVVCQFLHFKMPTLIGRGGHLPRAACLGSRYGNGDARYARAVGKTHVALYPASMLAFALHGNGLGDDAFLAVCHGADIIVVVLGGRYGLVLILKVGKVGGNPLELILAADAAVHLEIIHRLGVIFQFPFQQH